MPRTTKQNIYRYIYPEEKRRLRSRGNTDGNFTGPFLLSHMRLAQIQLQILRSLSIEVWWELGLPFKATSNSADKDKDGLSDTEAVCGSSNGKNSHDRETGGILQKTDATLIPSTLPCSSPLSFGNVQGLLLQGHVYQIFEEALLTLYQAGKNMIKGNSPLLPVVFLFMPKTNGQLLSRSRWSFFRCNVRGQLKPTEVTTPTSYFTSSYFTLLYLITEAFYHLTSHRKTQYNNIFCEREAKFMWLLL